MTTTTIPGNEPKRTTFTLEEALQAEVEAFEIEPNLSWVRIFPAEAGLYHVQTCTFSGKESYL